MKATILFVLLAALFFANAQSVDDLSYDDMNLLMTIMEDNEDFKFGDRIKNGFKKLGSALKKVWSKHKGDIIRIAKEVGCPKAKEACNAQSGSTAVACQGGLLVACKDDDDEFLGVTNQQIIRYLASRTDDDNKFGDRIKNGFKKLGSALKNIWNKHKGNIIKIAKEVGCPKAKEACNAQSGSYLAACQGGLKLLCKDDDDEQVKDLKKKACSLAKQKCKGKTGLAQKLCAKGLNKFCSDDDELFGAIKKLFNKHKEKIIALAKKGGCAAAKNECAKQSGSKKQACDIALKEACDDDDEKFGDFLKKGFKKLSQGLQKVWKKYGGDIKKIAKEVGCTEGKKVCKVQEGAYKTACDATIRTVCKDDDDEFFKSTFSKLFSQHKDKIAKYAKQAGCAAAKQKCSEQSGTQKEACEAALKSACGDDDEHHTPAHTKLQKFKEMIARRKEALKAKLMEKKEKFCAENPDSRFCKNADDELFN